MSIRSFVDEHYHHFNAASLRAAAVAYNEHLKNGHKMLVSLAGAMSTAELGRSLAPMIKERKVHAISCTGANLEEDVFNLVAHNHYKRVPEYRSLSEEDEMNLLAQGLNRVTDTCIPEEEAFRRVEGHLVDLWKNAIKNGKRYLPHEIFYELLLNGTLKSSYQARPENSWMLAAAENNLPLFVPGWEDSTIGNVFAAFCIREKVEPQAIMKSGLEYMMELIHWYPAVSYTHLTLPTIGCV